MTESQYKTQKIDTQTKEKNLKTYENIKNSKKHAIHIHTLKIYKASLKTLKQVINENIAQYSELHLFSIPGTCQHRVLQQ